MSSQDDLLKKLNEEFGHELKSAHSPESSLTPEEREARRDDDLREREVKVIGVFEHPKGTFVLLRDSRGRAMPIWIGPAEGLSISVALEGHTVQRPLSHDLMKSLLDQLGAELESVIIDDLHNSTYYAKLSLTLNSKTVDIDCRPSDAIALSVRTRAPIYVADRVLEEAQVDWSEE